MKTFTVKDFIAYNNPCFSCGKSINFKVYANEGTSGLRPTVKPDYTSIDLQVTYTSTLQLWVFHKTNKIISSDSRLLADYLYNHKIYLSTFCDCYSSITSQFLEFNLDKSYIAPVGISSERLVVSDDHNMYTIYSSFIDEETSVSVDTIDKTTPVSPIQFKMPLLPLYKIKTKERLINKLKTYVTFS